jgi:hypothetical protein
MYFIQANKDYYDEHGNLHIKAGDFLCHTEQNFQVWDSNIAFAMEVSANTASQWSIMYRGIKVVFINN